MRHHRIQITVKLLECFRQNESIIPKKKIQHISENRRYSKNVAATISRGGSQTKYYFRFDIQLVDSRFEGIATDTPAARWIVTVRVEESKKRKYRIDLYRWCWSRVPRRQLNWSIWRRRQRWWWWWDRRTYGTFISLVINLLQWIYHISRCVVCHWNVPYGEILFGLWASRWPGRAGPGRVCICMRIVINKMNRTLNEMKELFVG